MGKNSIIENLSFCVIDLETTGSFPQKDRIIDIGLVKMKGTEIISEKSFQVNPGIKIPKFIQKLTKIKQGDVERCPPIEDIIEEVLLFVEDSILVAHNISFDIPFLNGVLKRLGRRKLSNKTLCTHLMTQYLLPDLSSSNLKYLNNLFELPKFSPHRAIEDARMTSQLFRLYLKFFISRNISKVKQLYYPSQYFEFYKRKFSHGEKELLLKKLPLIKHPLYLSFHLDNGTLLASIPVENTKDELPLIQNLLLELNCHSIGVQKLSSYYEGLILFYNQQKKLPLETQRKLLSYLENKWAPPQPPAAFDFLITPHLIPDQFTLHIPTNPRRLRKIIYRYSRHEKRFFHQVKKSSKFLKRKRNEPSSEKKLFFEKVISPYFHQTEKPYLFFSQSHIIENPKKLWVSIGKLIEKKEQPKIPSPL